MCCGCPRGRGTTSTIWRRGSRARRAGRPHSAGAGVGPRGAVAPEGTVMTPEEFRADDRELRSLLEERRSDLPSAAVSDVQLRLANAELEMALESLGLSVTQAGVTLSPESKRRLRGLMLKYRLDQ